MKKLLLPLFLIFVVTATASLALALSAQAQFGNFESGIMEGSIDDAADPNTSTGGGLVGFINVIIRIVLGVVIGLGLIVFVIGGYTYMTAGGDAGRVGTAKSIMGAALLGIVLAIAASVILNEISPQFSEKAQNPSFQRLP